MQMIEKNILFEKSAIKEVLSYLKTSICYKWFGFQLINKYRYAIVRGREKSPNIAILLKTEPFMTFGEQFKDMGEKGVGDSINVTSLKDFVKNEVRDIYIMFRDGKIYTISLLEFLCNSHKWQQKEGTIVRSISIHKYNRVNEDEKYNNLGRHL